MERQFFLFVQLSGDEDDDDDDYDYDLIEGYIYKFNSNVVPVS